MTIQQFLLLLSVAILISFGQIFLKISSNNTGLNWALASCFNLWLILGLITYGVSMMLWLQAIKNIPLSLATPISGFAYIFVPLLSVILLDEKLTPQYFAGTTLIILGIFLTSISS